MATRHKTTRVKRAPKTGPGISYVIGPNGKKISLHDRTMTRRIHGRKGDKLLSSITKDVFHGKYATRSH